MTYSFTQISQYLTCPRRYRYRYLDGWKERDTRAAMLFGRAFELALGALFRREDPGAVLFKEWSACQSQDLHYSSGDSWDDMLRQGLILLTRFCQDNRVQVPASPEPAGQDHPSVGWKRLRCLHRCHWQTRWKALPARMENQFPPVSGPARGPALTGPTAGLLFVDHWHFERRPSCIRTQAASRGSVPANDDYRGTTSGVWPFGGRHRSSDRISGVPPTQWHTISTESVQHLPLRWAVSRKTSNGRRGHRASSRSRQPWLA